MFTCLRFKVRIYNQTQNLRKIFQNHRENSPRNRAAPTVQAASHRKTKKKTRRKNVRNRVVLTAARSFQNNKTSAARLWLQSLEHQKNKKPRTTRAARHAMRIALSARAAVQRRAKKKKKKERKIFARSWSRARDRALPYIYVYTTLRLPARRSTTSSARAWWRSRAPSAAPSPSARIRADAPMGSSIAGRTLWRRCRPTFPRTPSNCKPIASPLYYSDPPSLTLLPIAAAARTREEYLSREKLQVWRERRACGFFFCPGVLKRCAPRLFCIFQAIGAERHHRDPGQGVLAVQEAPANVSARFANRVRAELFTGSDYLWPRGV